VGQQEFVNSGEGLDNPVYYQPKFSIVCPSLCFSGQEFAAKMSTEETMNWLHMTGKKKTPKVVSELQVGCGCGGLVHRSNDVGANFWTSGKMIS
jgi:hypothetical protein